MTTLMLCLLLAAAPQTARDVEGLVSEIRQADDEGDLARAAARRARDEPGLREPQSRVDVRRESGSPPVRTITDALRRESHALWRRAPLPRKAWQESSADRRVRR